MYYSILDGGYGAAHNASNASKIWTGPAKSPLKRFGGKAKLGRFIASLLPPHRGYVETHAGAGHVLFGKRPSEVELIADLDPHLVELWRAIADPVQNEQLVQRLLATPNTLQNYQACRQRFLTGEHEDQLDRLKHYYVLTQCSYNGAFCGGWSRPTRPCDQSAYINRVLRLRDSHVRMGRVDTRCADFRTVLTEPALQAPDIITYCDPPYLRSTRSKPDRYQHEMTDRDHLDLLDLLVRSPGMVLVSGYGSEMYDQRLAAWKRVELSVAQHSARARAAETKSSAVEVLWINPQAWSAMGPQLRQLARGADPMPVGLCAGHTAIRAA